jgi:anaerobic magnesium-protoporphyrin IX monomethyl ester cyclase
MMISQTVIFIAHKEYDNLGLGYMASLLSVEGFAVRVIDISKSKKSILSIVKKLNPVLIGYSVIFQYNFRLFIDLSQFLRNEGIGCHFTAGGHYASLKYEELFEYMPSLDSAVLFEGEYTVVELARSLHSGSDWKKTDGIAYKADREIMRNPLRPLVQDLDSLPFPQRAPLRTFAFDQKFATILAGRGCTYDCSFCNIRKYYSNFPQQIKRIRQPEMVAKEMNFLYRKHNCRIFLFLDDDFPLKPPKRTGWVSEFCDALKRAGLKDEVLWKISCRPDEVDEKSFKLMKEHGLSFVFLGIEDGTNEGLRKLNKHLTVETTIKATELLKRLNIRYDYGFMLFQPDTTFESMKLNLDFLSFLSSGGYSTVTFLKMMPYYETKLEKDLIREGRLKFVPENGLRDYDFFEESMNDYYGFITDCFKEWLRYTDGFENTSNWALNYFSVYLEFFNTLPEGKKLYTKVRRAIGEGNGYILKMMKELSSVFESGRYKTENALLENYKNEIAVRHSSYRKRVMKYMAELISSLEYQQINDYMRKTENAG